MSLPRNLLNSKRERVLLAAELGRGGEGAVFALDGDSSAAAKIYLGGRADERREKILAMVAGRWSEKSPNVAFPIDALFDASNKFVGFTMRRIGGQKPIHSLYSPTSRKTEFPKASFRFLVRVALNIARSVANVHSTGCVIGDINHSGILVAEDATVTLIDCDSFQVAASNKVFHCKVGVPEFTPPELQGRRLADVTRSANHDAFGLAILLFNLLFMGRHPFAGRYSGQGDMPMEKAIAEFRFAYSARTSETRMSPPPNVPTLADLPKKLAHAFELSFGPAGANGRRPTSAEWVTLISDAEKEVVQCAKSPAHEYFSGAKSCPWCAMEKAYPGFLAFALPLKIDNSAPVDIGQLIAAISSVRDPGNAPALRELLPAPPAETQMRRGLFDGLSREYGLGLLSCIAAIQLFFWSGPSWLIGAALFVFGVWHAFRARGVLDEPLKAKEEIERAIANIETSWSRVRDNQAFGLIKTKANELIHRFQGLGPEEARRLADLKNRIQDLQRRKFLENFYIEKAKIKGVGQSRKLTLESYGIETAADVDANRIMQISGFGPATVNAILAWRGSIEAKFRFNPALGVDPKDILIVKSDIARQRADCQANLNKQLLLLREQSQRLIQAREQLKSAAEPVWKNLHIAEANLAQARSKLPSDAQKWMFGIIVCVCFYVLNTINFSGGSKPSASVSPPKASNTETAKNVAMSGPPAIPVQGVPKSVEAAPIADPAKPQAVPPKLELPPLAAPVDLKNPVVASIDPQAQQGGGALPAQINDIRNRDTVRWLQGRLQELGYWKGSSSGVFDGNTLDALRDFKATSSGRMDDDWDIRTQQALASQAAVKYRDSFVGFWSEGTACRSRSEADVMISARSARSSAGGTCRFQTIALTRSGWDIRTSCSNKGEQWNATIQFSISGEYLFWRGRDGSTTRYARCVG